MVATKKDSKKQLKAEFKRSAHSKKIEASVHGSSTFRILNSTKHTSTIVISPPQPPKPVIPPLEPLKLDVLSGIDGSLEQSKKESESDDTAEQTQVRLSLLQYATHLNYRIRQEKS